MTVSGKTVKQLLEQFKRDPTSLTPRELMFMKRLGKPKANAGDYNSHRDNMAARGRAQSKTARDIAGDDWVHPPANPERRAACERNFRLFCESYFPHTFSLAWSRDHLRVIAKIEAAALAGELLAIAMPRGSGKTSLCEIACVWATIYGHHAFTALIGSDEGHARNMLESIKSELENNDLLHEDFSETTGPVRALEGIHQRAGGQTYQGKLTHIGWTEGEIILPTLPGLKWLNKKPPAANGGIIRVAGITGRVRGMKFKRPDGRSVRPSLVLVDDPQTDESARSPSQCKTRESILSGAILGMAGPGRKIAGLMTLTVVFPEDMADNILNRQKHPEWNGERTKMVYAFPEPGGDTDKLWQEYQRIRDEGRRADKGTSEATEFYRANRAAMDAGFDVAWPERFNPDELSAIQHAMNLRYDRGDASFMAEYQNDPPAPEVTGQAIQPADQIADRVNGVARGVVPLQATHLTAFVDVQGDVLYWMVCAWEDTFTGYVIDYGTVPDQKRPYFTLREVRRTLSSMTPGASLEAALMGGFRAIEETVLARQWLNERGTPMSVTQALVDANWGLSTEFVRNFCRRSSHAAIIMPAHGRFYGASTTPINDRPAKRGERVGHAWRSSTINNQKHIIYDSNNWKSFVHTRLATHPGDTASLTLFGKSPFDHRMLADHLVAEKPVRTMAAGRTVDEWKLTPGADNHLLDCLVGCAVAASMLGVSIAGVGARPEKKRRKVSLSGGGRR